MRNPKKRGIIGDVAETLRQAFGRAPVTRMAVDSPLATVVRHETPSASVEAPLFLEFAHDTIGEELFSVVYAVADVSIESHVEALLMPQEMCISAREGFDDLKRPGIVEVDPGRLDTPTLSVRLGMATRSHDRPIPSPRVPRIVRTKIQGISTETRSLAMAPKRPGLCDGGGWLEQCPMRRSRISATQLGRAGMIRALRALVEESGLSPREIELSGVFGPVPDARPSRLEVDAGGGILLLWYPLRVKAKSAASLAVGRRVADGKLLAARLP